MTKLYLLLFTVLLMGCGKDCPRPLEMDCYQNEEEVSKTFADCVRSMGVISSQDGAFTPMECLDFAKSLYCAKPGSMTRSCKTWQNDAQVYHEVMNQMQKRLDLCEDEVVKEKMKEKECKCNM
jgi:hypothetical protein